MRELNPKTGMTHAEAREFVRNFEEFVNKKPSTPATQPSPQTSSTMAPPTYSNHCSVRTTSPCESISDPSGRK
jgi:hypothetical protein